MACLYFGSRCLKARVCEEGHHVIGRVGQQHRDPMKLIHMVGGIDPLGGTEGAVHFNGQFEVDHVDDLVAIQPEFPP